MQKIIWVLVLIFILAGCNLGDTGSSQSSGGQPKTPPELTFMYLDISIEPVLGMKQWHGAKVDRQDTLVAFMDKHLLEDMLYVKNGESIEIQVGGSLPDEMSLMEVIVGEDGRALYTYREDKLLPIEVTDEVASFRIEENMAAMLSSQTSTYEPGGLLRGYQLTCSWGDNACEYGFVVRSDAGFTSSEIIRESMSEKALGVLQDQVFKVAIEEDLLPLQSAWVNKDDAGIPTLFFEIREEEGVEEEAYRRIIYDLVGYEFPLVLELIPFPTEATFHGLVYETDRDNHFDQKGFIGNVLIFSTENRLPDYSPDAVWATITEKTEIIDQNGRPIMFDQIQKGMTVSNYYRGLTYTTYPGHQGCERLVVETSVISKTEGVPLTEALVFGEGGFIDEGQGYVVTLEMTDGNYLWGKTIEGIDQNGWLGRCQLVLTHKDVVIDRYDLSKDWPEGLYIADTFTVYTEDYDKDGITEVLIGQAYEDNSYGYQLYGMSDEGIFRYGGYDTLKISAEHDQRYSTTLNVEDHEAWSYVYKDGKGEPEARVIRFEEKNIEFIGNYKD